MSWIAAIALAALAFAVAALALRLPRRGWTALAAALALGLAGYATQASPGLPAAPKTARVDTGEAGWEMVKAREEMIGIEGRSPSNFTIMADGQARAGRYADAIAFYEGAVAENAKDVDAWIGLANALVEHADGTLSPAALYAYRQAAIAQPGGTAPGYFLGLALIRQGALVEARDIWATTLANADDGAQGREALAERLGRLDELLQQAGALPEEPAVPEQSPTGTAG